MPVDGGLSAEDKVLQRTELAFGALLHDIGKVIYRGSSARGTHAKLGADFLTDEVSPRNSGYCGEVGTKIIEQVRYHHAKEIAGTQLADDSLAYVTYFADNISAGMDRKNEGEDGEAAYFDRDANLRKIFNILNDHHDDNVVAHEDYNVIREDLKRNLMAIEVSWPHVNSLINMLEATVDKVPSSTNMAQLIDVSLFDHLKTTAGIAACILEYLDEHGVSNYHTALFDRAKSAEYYDKKMFLLYSCDMSGIQDFIYGISGEGALKQLRARSLYLEMLLEHIADELLDRLGLSRANLLYTGGGHAYLLLPNSRRTIDELLGFKRDLDAWFLDQYRTDLYVASAWVECSANDLSNKGGSGERYRSLYRSLSCELSQQKAARYSASQIRQLNFGEEIANGHGRECKECHRSDLEIDDEGRCPLCASLARISPGLVKKDVFVVVEGSRGLSLPFDKSLVVYSKDEYLAKRPKSARVYTKNSWDTGLGLATHIWMGDYTADTGRQGMSDYALWGSTTQVGETSEKQQGIKRLGVLRADVDNLGMTFVNGLPDTKVSISRSATLSRSISYFFKYQVNKILEYGNYRVQIIYSGGDDLFIIGNWSDVIHAAIDIRQALDEFTGNGTLTISAGVGMFDDKYPIASMARETGELEDVAKLYERPVAGKTTKNAVSLWTMSSVFGWEEFIGKVVPYEQWIREVFDQNDKGKAFLYRLVHLLRDAEQAISAPRLAYLLARSFEGSPNGTTVSQRLYDLAMDSNSRKDLVAALEWYVYSTRERS